MAYINGGLRQPIILLYLIRLFNTSLLIIGWRVYGV